jgi:hypothetical protein
MPAACRCAGASRLTDYGPRPLILRVLLFHVPPLVLLWLLYAHGYDEKVAFGAIASCDRCQEPLRPRRTRTSTDVRTGAARVRWPGRCTYLTLPGLCVPGIPTHWLLRGWF